ncbi:MAG TPA: hypothetical protein VHD91_01500 [Gaiellaceae bacterium]|nr:hypothetical protein [Gaiellaceae bacterium]
MDEPSIALRVREQEEPGLEVRVNFGVFAGRHATPAEIDDLARALREAVPAFAIVAEERHEFGGLVEASVHQVVIEVAREHAGDDEELAARVVALATDWTNACVASRHGGGEL